MPSDSLSNEVIDGTEIAKNIIECISQIRFPCGATHIATILAGKRWKNVLKYGHDGLPCFGANSEYSVDQLVFWIHDLVTSGYLYRSSGPYPVINLTDTSASIINGAAMVQLSKPVGRKIAPQLTTPYDESLFDILRQKRYEISQKNDIVAYTIFTNKELAAMCRIYPCTNDQLKSIPGIGDKKAEQYGEEFLSLIRQYMDDNQFAEGKKYESTPNDRLVQGPAVDGEDMFATAYELQEYILTLNTEINEAKKALNSKYKEIIASGIQQNNGYQMSYKERWIRSVDQVMFYHAYPDEFLQFAKIPVGKAELVAGPEEIDKYIKKVLRETYKVEKMD